MTEIATPPLKNPEPRSQQIVTDQWISATWDEFVQILENPQYADSRCYYDKNQIRQMRIETELISSAHALDHGLMLFAICLYCTLAAIPARGLINCSYTKTGFQGFQPDISYYIGESASLAPRSNSVVNPDEFAVPNLVIEISSSTLNDDLGKKRLLYEQLGTSEYWVVDVQEVKIFAFEMIDGGSRQIAALKLLGGLAIADLEDALKLSREKSQSEVGAWLIQKFS